MFFKYAVLFIVCYFRCQDSFFLLLLRCFILQDCLKIGAPNISNTTIDTAHFSSGCLNLIIQQFPLKLFTHTQMWYQILIVLIE